MTTPDGTVERGHRYLEVHHCPRCGAGFGSEDFKPDDCVFICKTCSFDFYQNPLPSAVAVVVDARRPDDILLLKRRTPPHVGRWCVPGGFIRYGEAPESAAVREVQEEVGAHVRVDRLLRAGLVDYTYHGRSVWVVELGYLAYLTDPHVFAAKTTEEASEMSFYSVDDILASPNMLAFPEQAALLDAYRTERHSLG